MQRITFGDLLGLLHQVLGLLDRGDVDQAAVERHRALAFLGSLFMAARMRLA